MKKILLLVGLVPFFGFSQIFSENFDAAASMPAGWAMFRGADDAGTAYDWTFIATPRNFSPPNAAFVRYEDGGVNEDWLVTPQINLSGLSNSALTFYGSQQYNAAYGTTYEIRVSTTSQTDRDSFTSIQTYAESDFSNGSGPLIAADMKTVDLSAYNGQQIYIAFVMTQDDGDNWFIDNVVVDGTLSTNSSEILGFSHAYNANSQILHLKANTNLDDISIFNVQGQNVLTQKSNDKIVYINLSNFSNGVYVVKVLTNNQTETFKIIKK